MCQMNIVPLIVIYSNKMGKLFSTALHQIVKHISCTQIHSKKTFLKKSPNGKFVIPHKKKAEDKFKIQ